MTAPFRFELAWSGFSSGRAVDLSRTTLCVWVADIATALTLIDEELRRQVTAATYLQTDDTPVTILKSSGGSRKGRLWTYLDAVGRQVVFDATPTHERDGPETLLAAFAGDPGGCAESAEGGCPQMPIMISIPDECKSLADAVQQLVASVERAHRRAEGGRALDYASVERDIGARAAAIERVAHQSL